MSWALFGQLVFALTIIAALAAMKWRGPGTLLVAIYVVTMGALMATFAIIGEAP